MLSRLKSTFSLLQYVDIEENPVPFNDLPSVITEGQTAIQEPVIGPIRTPATKLVLNRYARRKYRLPCCQYSIGVVGMERPRPALSHRLFSGLASVIQPTLAQKIGCSVRQSGPHIGRHYINQGPKLSLALPDCFLCSLPAIDIHREAIVPNDLTVGVTQRFTRTVMPPVFSICTAQAVY